jgi:hypothetical protein
MLVAGVVALIGAACGITALTLFFFALGETGAQFVTWRAVSYLVAAVVLAMGASACMKYANRVLMLADQKVPPVL